MKTHEWRGLNGDPANIGIQDNFGYDLSDNPNFRKTFKIRQKRFKTDSKTPDENPHTSISCVEAIREDYNHV
ncbi:TPA: hypothetical protein G8N95_001760 [Salmonella enterica]|uniref:Uncharacterized protein n=1 Tax=Salmonella enterica TaxID=28901 RepID=A0A749Z7V0_SALER|nr:hypothetical protein [Salmonella enterica]EBR9917543.1 hypothetical protein [Salmonella enterica subsp. enterica serovar Richmond]ECA9679791.1 hypothetical protein [Salmonella enterica subsp. enterica serovar Mikawasima]ECF2559843.1 hypothetical protein [Salmonella enterica subsp. enterica serovar Ahuza]ECH0881735.1 hypothetical protein [Salmonella enterica subsp. enterica serovar Potsdam]EDE8443980.1 hypothetical protein [Salmonella enterica subsp. enterica serovar Pomona]EDN8394558.1 hyp